MIYKLQEYKITYVVLLILFQEIYDFWKYIVLGQVEEITTLKLVDLYYLL